MPASGIACWITHPLWKGLSKLYFPGPSWTRTPQLPGWRRGRPRRPEGEGEGGGPITAYDLNERLGFDWTLFGVPSRVTISLSPQETDDGPATKVAIEHAFEGVFDMPRPKEFVKVFRALTEPECLNQWMAKEARVDLREGGAFDLGFLPEGYQGPGMRILELLPNEKITFSWPDWRGDTSVPLQSVSWILASEGL